MDRTTEFTYTGTLQASQTVTDESTSQTISSTAYTYNLQGRMESVTITTYTSGVASRIEKTTYGYDAMGLRVSSFFEVDADADETFEERTLTQFLIDPNNFTGYAQVLRETHLDADTEEVTKTVDYTFGHDEISQTVTLYDSPGATAETPGTGYHC